MPDFVVVGAAKAGTSTLTAMLDEHGAFFVPDVHEPGFLAWRDDGGPVRRWATDVPADVAVRDAAAYDALWADPGVGRGGRRRLGVDVSPLYFESAVAPARIAEAGVPAIVTLRDPTERAWSSYWMHRRGGLETRPPEDAFTPGEHRVQTGFYARNLAAFDRVRLHVTFFEEWTAPDPSARAALAEFLGVDPTPWAAAPEARNPGGAPRVPAVERAGRAVGRRLPALVAAPARVLRDALRDPMPPLPDDLRAHLDALYADDRAALAERLGRELPWG